MQPCGLDEVRKKMIQDNPSLQFEFDQYEQQINQIAAAQAMSKSTAITDTIPVVFHIVLRWQHINNLGGIQGIIDRCKSQIDALNRDYNAQNADSVNIPAAFKPLYGNAKIHFGLAHTAPNGAASPGYTIDTVTIAGFDPMAQGSYGSGYICSDAKYAAAGGADAWNTAKYLNVWVVNTAPNGTQGGFVAGIATHPSMINQLPAVELGCVIHYGTFGRREAGNQYFINNLDSGRVLVHEVGHFLGLWHVWGNDQGGCTADDGVADTPPQDVATQSYCPTFPLLDNCTPTGNGVMFMNYMDYSSENCQHMFSNGQVAKINAAANNSYPSLTTHPELIRYPIVTGVSQVAGNAPAFTVSPNPARNTVMVNVAGNNTQLRKISIINNVGQVMNAITAENGRDIYAIDVQGLSAGMYFVQCAYQNGVETQKIIVE